MGNETEFDWEAVLRAAAELQRIVPGAVLVGGSAAAIHVGHRFSMDADHVLPDLQQQFEALVEFLEQRGDWVTSRLRPDVLILGMFKGVETGLRQLKRTKPLETEQVKTAAGAVRVPTVPELMRVKGWLIVTRNATRDYIDFAALSAHLGRSRYQSAMRAFDACYIDIYRPGAERDLSPLLQLARQLSEPRPYDLDDTDVRQYKGVAGPWDDWRNVAKQCGEVAADLSELLTDDKG